MSIPYLPGWWDEINKGNAASNLFARLPEMIQPDRVAGKRYQEMIQQNPMLIESLSNMDDTQRQAFASALGFRDYNKSGFGNIAPGEKLLERRELQDFLKTATREQREIRLAGKAGTKTTKDISQADQLFGLNVKGAEQTVTLNEQKLKLQDMELKEKTEMQTLVDTLRAKYPNEQINLQKSMVDFVSGKINTPELQRITTDPTIAPAFNTLLELYKERIRLAAQTNIASLKGPQEKLLGVQFLQQGVDNALQKINAARQAIKDAGIFGQIQQTPEFVNANRMLTDAQTEHKQLVEAFNSALKTEFGGKYPDVFSADKIGLGVPGPTNAAAAAAAQGGNTIMGGMPNPTINPQAEAQQALEAIRKFPNRAAAIRAAYKQRTGRDLPQ
jgi:hypothetical protein